MTKRMAMALASCLALASCGGNDGPSNAAVGKTFTYGSSSAYSTSSLDAQLQGTLGVGSASAASSSSLVGSSDTVAASLLGSSGVGASVPAQQQALATSTRAAVRQLTVGSGEFNYQFENPSCVTVSATSVTMKACTVTSTFTSGTDSSTSKIQVDGSVTYDQSKGELAWDLTATDAMTFSSSGQSGSVNAALHDSGTLTVTASTIKGQLLAELSASASAAGQSASAAVSEAVVIDVTYEDVATCSTRIDGGTLEAKRVWTQLPSGATGPQYSNAGVKVTWTGCGTGTIAYSN
jgi:hypothetical protein